MKEMVNNMTGLTITNAIISLAEALNKVSDTFGLYIQNIEKIDTVKTKNNLKKACDIAEKILMLIDRNDKNGNINFDIKDRKLFNKYKEQFFKAE